MHLHAADHSLKASCEVYKALLHSPCMRLCIPGCCEMLALLVTQLLGEELLEEWVARVVPPGQRETWYR